MPIQSSLQSLLLFVVIIWSSLAAFGPRGVAVAVIPLTVAVCVRAPELVRELARAVMARRGYCLLVGALGLLLLAALSLSNSGAAREAPRRLCCLNNVKQIMLGICNYESAHGRFPPAYTTDAAGRPMHSWRVLILPYIERTDLFEKYHFDEPWDGPNNRKLATETPREYLCPSQPGGPRGTTSYVAVVGPHTVWQDPEGVPVKSIPDGAPNSVMIVEVADSGINWMEPRDLSFEMARRGLGPNGKRLGVWHRNVRDDDFTFCSEQVNAVSVGFVDASARSLRPDIPAETWEALLTIDGGESVDVDQLPAPNIVSRSQSPKWGLLVSLEALVVSSGLLILRPRKRAQDEYRGRDVV
ncbi:MAG: DUF1559 domain-containing protein [Pirellulales bacterium]|nr:DUF1559 domain-containing protein [Pirellulales bacterium]